MRSITLFLGKNQDLYINLYDQNISWSLSSFYLAETSRDLLVMLLSASISFSLSQLCMLLPFWFCSLGDLLDLFEPPVVVFLERQGLGSSPMMFPGPACPPICYRDGCPWTAVTEAHGQEMPPLICSVHALGMSEVQCFPLKCQLKKSQVSQILLSW